MVSISIYLPKVPGHRNGGTMCPLICLFVPVAVGEGSFSVRSDFNGLCNFSDHWWHIHDLEGSGEQLREFILTLNNWTIHLTDKWDKEKVDFLDVVIKCDVSCFLQTNIYRKEMSMNSFLYAKSSHPKQKIQAIPTGQLLRMRWICLSDTDFKNKSKIWNNDFWTEDIARNLSIKHIEGQKKPSHSILLHTNKVLIMDPKAKFITNSQSKWDLIVSILANFTFKPSSG